MDRKRRGMKENKEEDKNITVEEKVSSLSQNNKETEIKQGLCQMPEVHKSKIKGGKQSKSVQRLKLKVNYCDNAYLLTLAPAFSHTVLSLCKIATLCLVKLQIETQLKHVSIRYF